MHKLIGPLSDAEKKALSEKQPISLPVREPFLTMFYTINS